MEWFFISLVPPLFFVATNLLDVFLIRKIVGGVAIGALIFFTGIAYVVLCIIAVFHIGGIPHFVSANYWSLLAGMLWVIYLVPYYQALGKYQPDVVIAYFTLIPVFLLFLGYAFLDETLHPVQVFAILFIIVGVLGASVGRIKDILRAPRELILKMALVSFLIASGVLAFKFGNSGSYWDNTFYFSLSAALTVFFMFFRAQYRIELRAALRKTPGKFIAANLANEVLDQAGGVFLRYAQAIGPVALVQAVGQAVQPIYILGAWTIILSLGIARKEEGRGSEWRRLAFLVAAAIGVLLIYQFSAVGEL